MRLTFLGTGTSVGVPQIGCDCPTCTSADPRDRRRRCGVYVVSGETAFLVDTPPELREACLAYGVKKVDAVLLTHAHMDHVAGFDDIRRFNTLNGTRVPCLPGDPLYRGVPYRIIGKPMSCYALPETIEAMHRIFPYIGAQGGANGLFRPQISYVDNTTPFRLGQTTVSAVRVEHAFPCCGYIFAEGDAKLGYVSDCHELADAAVEAFRGVDVMVLNCLRLRAHPTHLDWARARDYLARIQPKKAYLIHMCHDLSHVQWLDLLRGTVAEPAYDGLVLTLGRST